MFISYARILCHSHLLLISFVILLLRNCAEVRIVESLPEVQSEVGEALDIIETSSITDAILEQQEEVVEDLPEQQVQVEATESLAIPERTHSKTIIGYYASWQW